MNKKGSHVGVMLSFALFITFVIFMYSVLSPSLNIDKNKQATAEYLEDRILEYLHANYTTTSITINENPAGTCIILEDLLLVTSTIPYVIVKDIDQTEETAKFSFTHLVVERSSSSKTFFRIFFSPEFDEVEGLETPEGCDTISYEDYSISKINKDRYVFKSRIDELFADYEEMKTTLSIPSGNDFQAIFIEDDEEEQIIGETPESANIYVEEIPIQYIDYSANIRSGFLKVKVW